MERKQIQVTTNHVVCPNCAKAAGGIDHLKGRSYDLRWYCDHCGYQFAFEINKEGVVENTVRLTGEQLIKTLVLLRCGDVGLVVQGIRFGRHTRRSEYGIPITNRVQFIYFLRSFARFFARSHPNRRHNP